MNEESTTPKTPNPAAPLTYPEMPGNEAEPLISIPWRYILVAAFVAALLFVLFIWLIVYLANQQAPTIEAVRDVMVIILALESCIFGVAFLIMMVMIIRLINMMEFEVKPILQKTNETLNTMRGTTTFVSQNVVQPTIKAKSHVAGVRRGLKTLFGNPRNNIR
ncbi:MAG TPA: hypothetical protein ENK32_09060 [Anaerolineae bacterium]|nr:hypothetical protein [Anaerolineae bacterium]